MDHVSPESDYYRDNIDWQTRLHEVCKLINRAEETSVVFPYTIYGVVGQFYFHNGEGFYEHDGKNFCHILVSSNIDTYHKILSVKLYDKQGDCIYETDHVDISTENFHILKENITDLDLCKTAMPYTCLFFRVPCDGLDPAYYRLEFMAQILTVQQRKNLRDTYKNWLGLDIVRGELKINDNNE